MGRKALLYSFGLIALYLGVEYATGLSKDVNSASQGANSLVKTFQARA